MELTESSGRLCYTYFDDHGWTKNRGQFSKYEYTFMGAIHMYLQLVL